MNRLLVLVLAVLALLPACGGGSTGYTPTPSASPVPPVELSAGIYRLPRDGAVPIPLAQGQSFSICRDLRWLAITTQHSSNTVVNLLDLETGGSPVATGEFQGVYGFAVAPDGRQVIVLGRLDTVKGIYSIDAATGAITKKVPIRGNEPIGSLEWSPIGDLFAFVGAPGERPPGLYVGDQSTWDTTLEAKTPSEWPAPGSLGGGPRAFAWSADGTRLALSSPYGEDRGLFVADVRSGEVQKVSDTLFFGGRLAWSPDSMRIAFSSGPMNGPAGRYGVQQRQVFVLDLRSGDETVLTKGYDPAWSPDGQEIVVVRDGGLYAIAADGNGARPIGPFAASHPVWLADGSLMFVSGAIQ